MKTTVCQRTTRSHNCEGAGGGWAGDGELELLFVFVEMKFK